MIEKHDTLVATTIMIALALVIVGVQLAAIAALAQ